MYTNQPGNSVGSPLMKTHEHRPQQSNKQPASAGTLGEKGTLPAQHTTLDNWAIKPPPNQKGKGPERKG